MFDVWLKVGRSRVRCPGQRLIPNCDPKMSILWLYQTVECHTGYTLTNTPTTLRLFLRKVCCIIAHSQAKVNWKDIQKEGDTGNQIALASTMNCLWLSEFWYLCNGQLPEQIFLIYGKIRIVGMGLLLDMICDRLQVITWNTNKRLTLRSHEAEMLEKSLFSESLN